MFGFHVYPWKLPCYPFDKVLLLELCKQIVQVTRQFGDQCLHLFEFSITIGNYSYANLDVAKSAEIDVVHLQINIIGNVCYNFDPVGRISTIVEKSYKHQPTLEDHWANCVNEKQIRKREYCRLLVELM